MVFESVLDSSTTWFLMITSMLMLVGGGLVLHLNEVSRGERIGVTILFAAALACFVGAVFGVQNSISVVVEDLNSQVVESMESEFGVTVADSNLDTFLTSGAQSGPVIFTFGSGGSEVQKVAYATFTEKPGGLKSLALFEELSSTGGQLQALDLSKVPAGNTDR